MIGTVVGNYKITQKIGEGGMGAVFKGIDLMLERQVAIKMLRPELASQPDVVERFRSEAVTLAKLNHPNIATLYSFLRQGNDFFMVMEYVEGATLDSLIRRNGAMPVERAVTLFCQALEGIGRAHKLGIIHRDIKPANMMLTTEDGSIKVMDFGIARVLGTARMTRQGNIVGTIEYMSPEAIQGQDVDARTDIYSLGILLYELLTGRLPFTSDTEFGMMMAQIQQAPPPPTTIAPHVPIGIERAIMRALAKRPEARFQTAGEFREALQAGLHGSLAATQITNPAGPAATLIAASPPTPASQPGLPKETRLGAPAGPGTGQAGGPKETRLGNVANQPYQYAPPSYQQPPPRPVTNESLLSKLTWVHYLIGAAILVALIAIPLLLIVVSRQQEQANPAQKTVTQPTQPASEPSQAPEVAVPASSPAPAPLGPQQQPGLLEPDISTGAQPAEASRAKPSKPAKKKEDDDLAKRRKKARDLLNQP
jgi:serine/threonine protein kinase